MINLASMLILIGYLILGIIVSAVANAIRNKEPDEGTIVVVLFWPLVLVSLVVACFVILLQLIAAIGIEVHAIMQRMFPDYRKDGDALPEDTEGADRK